jgi:predicted Rossmann fold flavoprotein
VATDAAVAVVGGGAAGLATAIFAARRRPGLPIAVLDGASRLGAKILVSGGGRCNVTNAQVTEADFNGGSRVFVRRILRELGAPESAAFFREIGVALHEEENGKLFPDSNRAHTVLDALLAEAEGRGVRLLPGHRVTAIRRTGDVFHLEGSPRSWTAGRVVLATGGLSLPKTGSDGTGYSLARSLGHSLVPTTPALSPLVLDGAMHAELSGVSLRATLVAHDAGRRIASPTGPLLWTHFGVSGPVVLDVSRHWLRTRLEGREASLSASFFPGETFEQVDGWLVERGRVRPRAGLASVLAERLPAGAAEALSRWAGTPPDATLSQLRREDRRFVVGRLVDWPLPVRDSRGYAFAEVTAGGIPLSEVDPRTMESHACPGLHLVGEILDVDGRLGGFNFQWSWSSAFVAARGLTP